MSSNKLQVAIQAGDLEKVRKLIASGADVEAAFADGTTPVQLAARERQTTILRALAGAGADLASLATLSLEERLTLFLDASLDTTFEEDLISADELSSWAEQAITDKMDSRLAAEISALEGELCRAIRIGDIELLQERIAAGDDVNQVRELTRDTPLTLALREGDEEMAEELLLAGANVDHQGFSTPLAFALPNLRLVKLLLDAGADVYGRGLDHRSAFERAVHCALEPSSAQDSPLLLRLFLETGVHPPSAESGDGSLLLEAELAEAWEVYHELLPHYPAEIAEERFDAIQDRDPQDDDGGWRHWIYSVEHSAVQGDVDSLGDLLAHPPESPQDEDARAPLLSDPPAKAKALGKALHRTLGHLEAAPQLAAVRQLIAAGADLDIIAGYDDQQSSTPLARAAESWQPQCNRTLRLLIEAGANVDQRGLLGRTPLMQATRLVYRHGAPLKKSLPLLLAAGADPNLQDELGYTAWTLAKAPLIEAEERERRGESEKPITESLFDSLDLSERFSETQNLADQRRGRLARCRSAVELLEKSAAQPHRELDLQLLAAAAAGDALRVEELLTAGADADSRSPDGDTALTAAARCGAHRVAQLLLDAGCQVDLGKAGGATALKVALGRSDAAMVRLLIDAGANIVMLVIMSRRLLEEAEAAGNGEIVQMIRDALPPEIAKVDREMERDQKDDDLYWEALRELPRQAALGDLERVRRYLAVDEVGVDDFDPLKRTALMAAAEAGRLAMVRELIAAGADVNLCNEATGSPRSTPLTCAAIGASEDRDQILQLLIEAGADLNQIGADGRTALMHAAERDVGFFGRIGDFALSTRTLISAGADLEIRDPYGLTAWMRARSLAASIDLDEAEQQYKDIAQLLEDAGASTDGRLNLDLMWAAEIGHAQRVQELLAAGADVEARRHDGATALMLAVRDGEHGLVQVLLDAGCDVNARQWVDRGPTALAAASRAGDSQLYRLLRAAGATPDED